MTTYEVQTDIVQIESIFLEEQTFVYTEDQGFEIGDWLKLKNDDYFGPYEEIQCRVTYILRVPIGYTIISVTDVQRLWMGRKRILDEGVRGVMGILFRGTRGSL